MRIVRYDRIVLNKILRLGLMLFMQHIWHGRQSIFDRRNVWFLQVLLQGWRWFRFFGMHGHFMSVKLTCSGVNLFACRTAIRVGLSVLCPSVVTQVARPSKTVPTHITRIWLFSCVNHTVVFKVVCLPETLVTQVTVKGPRI